MRMEYGEYQKKRPGGPVTEKEYPRYEALAWEYLEGVTRFRAGEAFREGGETAERLKSALCAVMELYWKGQEEIASESAGGVSVTYAANPLSLEQRLYQAVSRSLSGTGLLYRGLDL